MFAYQLPTVPFVFLTFIVLVVAADEHGIAVTLLSEREVEGIQLLGRVFKMEVHELPSPVPREIFAYTAASPEDEPSGQDVRITDQRQAKTEQVNVQETLPSEAEGLNSVGSGSSAAGEDAVAACVQVQAQREKPVAPVVGPFSSEFDREEELYSRWIDKL